MQMEMNNRLFNLKAILREFCSFIEPYRAILNNHNVQFLVDNHWQKFVDFDANLVKLFENLALTQKNLIRYTLSDETDE